MDNIDQIRLELHQLNEDFSRQFERDATKVFSSIILLVYYSRLLKLTTRLAFLAG